MSTEMNEQGNSKTMKKGGNSRQRDHFKSCSYTKDQLGDDCVNRVTNRPILFPENLIALLSTYMLLFQCITDN